MKKLLLYPCTAEVLPIILYIKEQQSEFELFAACAAKGTGIVGKDIGYAWNLSDIGVNVLGEPMELLPLCDTLCILPHGKMDISEVLKIAHFLEKEILYYADDDLIESECSKGDKALLEEFNDLNAKVLMDIEVPIIAVGGLIETADKDQIALTLTQRLRKEGIKVCPVSYHDSIYLADGHSTRVIGGKNDSVYVSYLNHFLKALEFYEKPDVLIVQIPGIFFRKDNRLIEDLGIPSFLFSQAFIPDYCISSMPLGVYDDGFLEAFNDSLQARFGFSLNAVHVSNHILNSEKSQEESKMAFYRCSENSVRGCIDSMRHISSFHVGNFFDPMDCEEIIQDVIKGLTI